jgi:G6PDH family F420-dependent oxidoreductase
VRVRHERLTEAVQIVRELFTGDYVSFSGRHFQVERARLYDLPDAPVPVGIAVSGPDSVTIAAQHGDAMIATQPELSLTECFAQQGGADKPVYGQVALCYGADEGAARARARRLWRWAAAGWYVMSGLPEPRSFDASSEHLTEDDIADLVPCGPDLDQHVKAVRQWIDAGFTHISLVQVGGGQQVEFAKWAQSQLLPALRSL